MNFEYYFDYDIQSTHLEKHSVSEAEIFEFFTDIQYIERPRSDNSFEAIGKLESGRYLRVAYRKKAKDLYFIITAYDIEDKELISFFEDFLDHESNK